MPEDITMFSLSGYSVGTLPGKNVFLRLEFLTGPLDRTGQSLRLSMTAAQARQLAKAVLRKSGTAERRTDEAGGAH